MPRSIAHSNSGKASPRNVPTTAKDMAPLESKPRAALTKHLHLACLAVRASSLAFYSLDYAVDESAQAFSIYITYMLPSGSRTLLHLVQSHLPIHRPSETTMFSLVNLIASTWFLSLFIPATASPSGTPASTTSTAANLRLSGRQVATGTSQSYNGTSDLLVTTTVSGSTFILTFVPTTAPAPILKTEPTTTITTTSEAPIWAVPILPIGWPGPPPVPPLDKPVPLPDLSAPLPDLSVPLPDLSVPLPDLPVPAPDHPVPSPDNPTPTGDEDDSTKCTSAAIPHCTEVCSFIYSISDHTVQTSTDCPSSSKICSTVTTCQPASTVADETKTATADRALETGDEATDVIDYLPGDWPANPEDGTHAQAPLNSDYAKLGIPPYTKCDGEKTDAIGVETNFFLALASVFCKSDLSKASVVELTNKDIPSRKRWIGARTPPPTTGGWAGYKFHFEWIPGAANCLGDCQAVFEDIAFQCESPRL